MQNWIIVLCLFFLSACADSSEKIKKQFQDSSQATVLDLNTKLMWAATDNRKNCTWQEAVSYCQSFTAGGFQDWRMPDKSELAALFAAGIRKEGEMIAINGERIWARETDDSKGAYCNFKSGGCSWGEKVMSITMRALPVRDTDHSVATVPPPPPVLRPQSAKQRLQVLESLHTQGLITDDEFTRKKTVILNEL